LLTYLLGADRERLEEDSSVLGRALENFVVTELRKQSSWSKTKPQLFHFRTQSGQEVDVVMEDAGGRLVGVEVKASATVTGGDFKGLHALREMTGNRLTRGIVLYAGAEAVSFGSDLFALPLASLWRPLSS
jgi:predicted AAA+ superfamily ATPase